jgi:hypothetical protein
MRSWISADYTSEPPGELMISATASDSLSAKSFSSDSDTPARLKPRLNPVRMPIAPLRRITDTVGGLDPETSRHAFFVQPFAM